MNIIEDVREAVIAIPTGFVASRLRRRNTRLRPQRTRTGATPGGRDTDVGYANGHQTSAATIAHAPAAALTLEAATLVAASLAIAAIAQRCTPDPALEILNQALETELVCHLRYIQTPSPPPAWTAQVSAEFQERAAEELQHGLRASSAPRTRRSSAGSATPAHHPQAPRGRGGARRLPDGPARNAGLRSGVPNRLGVGIT